MQEVFLRAAANARLYELHNPGGYLCRIAKSVLIDRARRRARQIRCIPIGCANEPESPPCQEDGLLEQGLLEEIDGLLAALPSRTQIVFSLSRYGGLSYRQIHEQLGMSEAAVEYHMMKALACLRQALGRD
jgi:RNA polymerase sigma-70 factor (ECF subfamily)